MEISKLEENVIKRWRSMDAFKKSVSNRDKEKRFVFYEGPPTANGMPGLHHILARSFKDVVCRYKTMRGFRVERRAGWDTHGLPVEIQVEKELGIATKKDIENYGIASFNKKCLDSVWKYKKEWEYMTERMGFWVDMDDPYVSCSPSYMESLFWILSELFKKDILYEGYRVAPLCTRCETVVSSHEVAQGYQDVVDRSVFVQFRVRNSEQYGLPENTSILVWTTTPWTLPANLALAVGEDIEYVLAEQDGNHYIIGKNTQEVLGEEYKVVKEFRGSDMVGVKYRPPFEFLENNMDDENLFRVYGAEFVGTDDGTGVVHIAPPYGEDDYQLALNNDIPVVHTVKENGRFDDVVVNWAGKNAKGSDGEIIKELNERSLLYKEVHYKHSYPFCWRCSTPLIYYAKHSWFIKMSSMRQDLIERNKQINWVPEYIKEGRFGEWLDEVKDWALSRSRYWGTPLPIWRCNDASCGEVKVLGSREDIQKATKGRNKYILVRHGLTEKNEKRIFAGKYPEPKKYPLLKKGISVVEKTAKEIVKQGGVDIIVCSPFERAKQTAEIVSKANGDVKVEVDERLKETYHGEYYEGRKVEELYEKYPDFLSYFYDDIEGSETFANIQHRMFDCIKDLEKKYEGKRIAIVSHGDPLLLLEKALKGWTNQEFVDKRNNKEIVPTGSFRELDFGFFPFDKDAELDFHRPYIDKIGFKCDKCKKSDMKREEYVADVWFDSGAMPYASVGYPFDNKKKIDDGEMFPADYITEAIDQTRGWFYTLLAVSVALGLDDKNPPFKNAISLGHILDSKGKKMSKSKGNIVDPIMLADRYGMDALRWYCFTINSPGDTKKFSDKDLAQCSRKCISILYNSMSFVKTYAPKIRASKKAPKADNVLEEWILARLKEVNIAVTQYMEDYDMFRASRLLEDFILNDVSRWYIRRSRLLFQKPESNKTLEENASVALYVLSETAKMMAPFTPFLAEEVWQKVNNTESKSVHWEDWRTTKKLKEEEQKIIEEMDMVRNYAQDVLRLRADNKIKVRQPLNAIFLAKSIGKELEDTLKDEVNVLSVVRKKDDGNWKGDEDGDVFLDVHITDELHHMGDVAEVIRRIQEARKDMGLVASDVIKIHLNMPEILSQEFEDDIEIISKMTGSKISDSVIHPADSKIEVETNKNEKIIISISKN